MTTPAHRLPPLAYRKEPGLLLTSAAQRKACMQRDKGICYKCGWEVKDGKFQADHEFPLHAIPPSMGFPEALKYWRIENIRLICTLCHLKKSIGEVKANAKVKRIRRRLDGTRRPRRKVPSRPVRKPKKDFKPREAKQINGGEP